MELSCVLYQVDEAVATITLNRPEQRNSLSARMLVELTQALATAGSDPAVRAVVLTGVGDKAFCAGADLAGFAAAASEVDKHLERGGFVDLFLGIRRLGKPVVAAVNGHALAGGMGLALCCDLVVAAETATFGTPEINVGLWPMMIMAVLNRHLPPKRALELYMTGERISARQAHEWGLVNRVVPADQVRPEAHRLATHLATKSPLVMRLGRDAFYAIEGMDFETALRHLQAQLTIVGLSRDAAEGVAAFLEKRAPHFTGH